MSNLKFKVGSFYKNRAGDIAYVTQIGGDYLYYAKILGGSGVLWAVTGTKIKDTPSDEDLISEVKITITSVVEKTSSEYRRCLTKDGHVILIYNNCNNVAEIVEKSPEFRQWIDTEWQVHTYTD